MNLINSTPLSVEIRSDDAEVAIANITEIDSDGVHVTTVLHVQTLGHKISLDLLPPEEYTEAREKAITEAFENFLTVVGSD